jgi:hypothetical protein
MHRGVNKNYGQMTKKAKAAAASLGPGLFAVDSAHERCYFYWLM